MLPQSDHAWIGRWQSRAMSAAPLWPTVTDNQPGTLSEQFQGPERSIGRSVIKIVTDRSIGHERTPSRSCSEDAETANRHSMQTPGGAHRAAHAIMVTPRLTGRPAERPRGTRAEAPRSIASGRLSLLSAEGGSDLGGVAGDGLTDQLRGESTPVGLGEDTVQAEGLGGVGQLVGDLAG
jgi:hypothetical protein